MSKNKIIAELENEQMGRDVPSFGPGDTLVVQVKVKEGNRERLQAFEGVVIGVRSRGLNSAFTLRKISHGIGVERTFQTYSPMIDSITVKRRGDVRQAKLYYLRERSGRSARIREKITHGARARARPLKPRQQQRKPWSKPLLPRMPPQRKLPRTEPFAGRSSGSRHGKKGRSPIGAAAFLRFAQAHWKGTRRCRCARAAFEEGRRAGPVRHEQPGRERDGNLVPDQPLIRTPGRDRPGPDMPAAVQGDARTKL